MIVTALQLGSFHCMNTHNTVSTVWVLWHISQIPLITDNETSTSNSPKLNLLAISSYETTCNEKITAKILEQDNDKKLPTVNITLPQE